MQIAELRKEEKVTLAQLARGIGAANAGVAHRYETGERIPDRARMRQLVIFSEGRVTPNDIYGLVELIDELRERRAARLAKKRRGAEPQPELPLLPPGSDPYYAPERPELPPGERKVA